MSNRQNILDKICMMYDSFFEQEKKVASYIMKNHRQVINMTINDLAKESKQVSQLLQDFVKNAM